MSDKNKSVESPKRAIRSFVRREGRMTAAQKRALDEQWQHYGLEFQTGIVDFDAIFSRHAPRFLDIGFGMGESLLAQAKAHPECDFVGIDVYRTGVGCLLHQCQQLHLHNVRVICHDAVEVLQTMIVDAQFDGIMVFFPDPWPKKRHHKRRLLQASNLRLLASQLKAQGYLHIATDWQNYAEVIEAMVAKLDELQPMLAEPAQALIEQRANTKYERRGQCLGHQVFDLVYQRRE